MPSGDRNPDKVLVLTADHEVDRRILQQISLLESAGWDVNLYSPLGSCVVPSADGQVPASRPSPREAGNSLFRFTYRIFRGILGDRGVAAVVKRCVWRLLSGSSRFLDRFHTLSLQELKQAPRPQVIIAHDLPMLPMGARLAEHFSCALIYDSHEFFPGQIMPWWESRAWKNLEKKYIGLADAIITVNASIAEVIGHQYGVAPVHVVQNVVDAPPGLFSAEKMLRTSIGLGHEERIVLYQGGLSAGRNLRAIVLAMKSVRNKSIRLVFLGDGEEFDDLKDLVRTERLDQRVFFHPRVAQDYLPFYTSDADIGIIPYVANCLNNRLCTPNKLYEFLAFGIPVLGTDLVEVRRILDTYECGCVVDMARPESIGAAIDAVFSDPCVLDAWKRNVRVARQELSWQREGVRWLEIFESAVDKMNMRDDKPARRVS
ncbi:glycosyltransferase [Paracidovorax citrulli]|uniref:glycosyltransferase n=1 Tax=Paracidovorax citrulli TaxID=80869 RepID=UPI0002E0773D|nr:glycosyltransferase [Paracidovorax citrulli]QCX11475.1 D-inositol-3-phosphate glycosyltransferase [Paracidovorax citrulli]UEG45556.1 glycosyltransferase [Paracidovorax citrulli]UMT95178.1 glycosyltransferase family 4 protein [Paracidovorax citrulli]